MVNEKNSENQSVLHLLVNSGHTETFKWFLGLKLLKEQKFDLNWQDNQGYSALILSILDDRFAIAELLLHEKVDVNLPTKDQNTALHYFVRKNLDEESLTIGRKILSELIENGANINAQNKFGETPLMTACMKGM